MKRLLILLLPLAFILSSCLEKSPSFSPKDSGDQLPMMVMNIKKCAKLYTSEFKVHKIITHEDQLKLKGTFLQQKFNITLPMTSRKIAIPMDATLKAYINFEDFSEKNVILKDGKIEIVLPDPKVELTDSRIDHKEIMRYVSFMRSNFSDSEMTNYENQGRAAILSSLPDLGIIDVAMENAAHTLEPMLQQMGYNEEDITITFRKKFTLNDLPLLLDANKENYGK